MTNEQLETIAREEYVKLYNLATENGKKAFGVKAPNYADVRYRVYQNATMGKVA